MLVSSEEELINDLLNFDSENIINQNIKKYISILKHYYKFKEYNILLNSLSIKEIEENDCKDSINNNDYITKLQLKFNNNFSNEIFLAPINFFIEEDFQTNFDIDINKMAVPMFHVHLVKGKIRDDFIYVITGEEKGYIKDFINRVQLLDKKIKNLIEKYIRNIQPTSPIYNLLKKNNVTETNNWIYNGIINGSENNFMHINFEKSSFEEDIDGTPIYIGNKQFYELTDVLSLNSYCFINSYIYPIFKLKDIIVTEKIKKNNKTIVSFRSKAYFPEIYIKQGSLSYSTEVH